MSAGNLEHANESQAQQDSGERLPVGYALLPTAKHFSHKKLGISSCVVKAAVAKVNCKYDKTSLNMWRTRDTRDGDNFIELYMEDDETLRFKVDSYVIESRCGYGGSMLSFSLAGGSRVRQIMIPRSVTTDVR